MPGGEKDSPKTRVVPVFDALEKLQQDWVRQLVSIPQHGRSLPPDFGTLNLTFEKGYWGRSEHPFLPSKRLLEWLVRNPKALRHDSSANADRDALLKGDHAALEKAIAAIQSTQSGRSWYLLEGTTCPDATLFTPDAIFVVEGKRTEAGPTLDTSWRAGRHQMWRHVEGAWEMRAGRRVFGFFLVEARDGRLPAHWRDAADATHAEGALTSSLPHLSTNERSQLAECFIGVATRQGVCSQFGISPDSLPETVDDLPAEQPGT